jgi:hypothetical protein
MSKEPVALPAGGAFVETAEQSDAAYLIGVR